MTDQEKEDFRLAAKAAGITVELRDKVGFEGRKNAPQAFYQNTGREWNPREDDGDALRLAVMLHVSVCHSPRISASWICDDKGTNISEVAHDDAVKFDPASATRLAIFRAAVKIGMGMK